MIERRIHRRTQLTERTGIPISTIYELIAQGKFPKPIKLTDRIVGWREDEIAEWERQRVAARDAGAAAAA